MLGLKHTRLLAVVVVLLLLLLHTGLVFIEEC